MPDPQIAIVTGANTGLGFETSLGLAKAGRHVILACRDTAKAEAAAEKIREEAPQASLETMALDLIDRPSVKAFAKDFASRHPRLDLLVNNAGVMGPEKTITDNGLELQFDANHVGHFLLTSHLMSSLAEAPAARVVTVSSLAGKHPEAEIRFDNLNWAGCYEEGPIRLMGLTGMGAYCQSKLANLLFTVELTEKLNAAGKENIISVAAHPGGSNTDLSRHMAPLVRLLVPVLAKMMGLSSPAEGAQSQLHAALDPAVKANDFFGPTGKGEYAGPPGASRLPSKARDAELRERLWTKTEELLGEPFQLA
ncbi:MAG: oxidoreductase [Pseudomonadota bacterium]